MEWLSRFRKDVDGAIAIIAAFSMVVLVAITGLGVDSARAYSARAALAEALDLSTLAATRDLSQGLATAATVTAVVQRYLTANVALRPNIDPARVHSLAVSVNALQGTVHASVSLSMDTTFLKVIDIDTLAIGTEASASYSTKIIELSLILDTTGSMSGTKIANLRAAATNLVNTLLPADGRNNARVRIALIPFSQGVNAGTTLAGSIKLSGRVVINNTQYASLSTPYTGCVGDRPVDLFTDTAPTTTATKLLWNDPYVTWSGTSYARTGYAVSYAPALHCPAQAVVPLTNNRTTLLTQINALTAGGGTAGHIGVAWGWYMLSPNWSALVPATSRPAAYTNTDVMKIVVFMTDGAFTWNSYSNNNPFNGNGSVISQVAIDHALSYCRAIKTRNIRIFTVAFDVSSSSSDDVTARNTMRTCATATTDFYEAENGTELNAAFETIGYNVNSIWLSQ